MAERKRKWQTDKTREKIRASMLVNRLQACAEGKADMSATQIKAAGILINKVMPDLTSADIHDTRQTESQTYEELRAQIVREHGEPLAMLLLKEITQSDYLRMVNLVKQTDKPDSDKVRKAQEDVAPSHSLASDTPIPAQDKPNLLQ